MHNSKIRLFVFLCFFRLIALGTNTFAAPDSSAAQVIAKVRNALNSIKPFQVSFVQQVYTDNQVDIQESGDIIFKDDQQLKWTYRDPDFKVFLLEGEDYKFYDEDNEQLMIGKVKDKNQQWIWQLLFADDILPDARWEISTETIHIDSKSRDIHVQVIINNLFLPVKVSQKDPSGARMVYLFNTYLKNISLPSDTFKLDVPANVEVVHD